MQENGRLLIVLLWRLARLQPGVGRRFRLFTAVAYTLLAAHPSGAATGRAADHAGVPSIRIAPGGWGTTGAADLQFVLDAVATEFGARFPGRALGNIVVVPGEGGPLVRYERGADGAYVVQLSARNARWYQFVYQFSHELCHIYSNFDKKVSPDAARGNQWFEESLCEAAALFTLRELAARWADEPPSSEWNAQAAKLDAYADYFLREPHRRLPAGKSFAAWFQANQPDLHANPYYRDRNEVVSNLLLPLFERDPYNWGAIGFLNHDPEVASKGFTEFLAAWHGACPEEYREVVRHIMMMFGDVPLDHGYAQQLSPAPLLTAH